MKSHIWENMKLFTINKELQDLIDVKMVKTVVSLSLTAIKGPYGSVYYSAILIYK